MTTNLRRFQAYFDSLFTGHAHQRMSDQIAGERSRIGLRVRKLTETFN